MAPYLKAASLLSLWGVLLAQKLLVGPSGRDTVLSGGKLSIRYLAPVEWQRDTFVLIVRNALGIVARTRLIPRADAPHQAELMLTKPGYFVLIVQHPRTGGRIWTSHRLYLLAPPYQTVAQVRAYHNALIARKPPPSPTPLPANEELLSLTEPFPEVAPLPDIRIEDDFLPDDAIAPVPEEGSMLLNEDDELDD